jgi:hypothetical protein
MPRHNNIHFEEKFEVSLIRHCNHRLNVVYLYGIILSNKIIYEKEQTIGARIRIKKYARITIYFVVFSIMFHEGRLFLLT